MVTQKLGQQKIGPAKTGRGDAGKKGEVSRREQQEGQKMTQFLPPNLLLLFQPRPPITYLPPIDKPKLPAYSGIAQFVKEFEDPKTVDYSQFRPLETRDQRRERKRKERRSVEEEKISKILATCM